MSETAAVNKAVPEQEPPPDQGTVAGTTPPVTATEVPGGEVPSAQDDAPVLFLRSIERHYRQGEDVLTILKGAELAVWPSQSVALVAPSGTGKSTLLHVAGLLEYPDGGEVYIDKVPTSTL